jgi:hypothetical protein
MPSAVWRRFARASCIAGLEEDVDAPDASDGIEHPVLVLEGCWRAVGGSAVRARWRR